MNTIVKAIATLLNLVTKILPKPIQTQIAAARKTVVALAGALITAASGLAWIPWPGQTGVWITWLIAAATAVVTWLAPNEDSV